MCQCTVTPAVVSRMHYEVCATKKLPCQPAMAGSRHAAAAAAPPLLLLVTLLLSVPAASADCMSTTGSANCHVSGGAVYLSWAAGDVTECQRACCADATCSGWTYGAGGVRGVCALVSGGDAFVEFSTTRAGVPYVRADAPSYTECQAMCCADPRCRGWLFTPATAPGCSLIESPGGTYAAASVVSGAFLKPFPSPSPAPYSTPSYSFETAFFLATFALAGGFGFAVYWLRRGDANAAHKAAQPSVLSTVRAVFRRRQDKEAEVQRERLRATVDVDPDAAVGRGGGGGGVGGDLGGSRQGAAV
jgi:hypothetical protein